MYEQNKVYKIQLDNGIIYTGKVIEEDSVNLKLLTIRGEEVIVSRYLTRQAVKVEEPSE